MLYEVITENLRYGTDYEDSELNTVYKYQDQREKLVPPPAVDQVPALHSPTRPNSLPGLQHGGSPS